MISIDYHSLTALPVGVKANGIHLGVATCFFHRFADVWYLISNWHVISGRSIYTGQPRHDSGAIPDELEITLHSNRKFGEFFTGYSIEILDEHNNPRWIMHHGGQGIDIAAVRLSELPENIKLYDVVADDDCSDMMYPVGSDVFVLGFPKGMQFQGPFPVWKRASIASEPEVKIDGKAQFLVDTATREGMSGSPVIAYSKGLYQSREDRANIVTGITKHFIGVYSGRFGADDEFGAQLGRVWKRELIDEMLSAPVLGNYVLRKS